MALAAARDVGIDVRPGSGLAIVGLAKERDVDVPAADDEPAGDAPVVEALADSTVVAEGQDAAPAPAVIPEVAPAATPPVPTTKSKSDPGGAKSRRPDRVFLPNAKDAIPIRSNTAEMFILQHLRDEAHRFAVTFHRSQRKRLTLRSALSTIPGIGAGRQRLLLRHFGSLKKIREASLEDLAAVPGVTRKAAGAVHAYWQRQPVAIGGTQSATAAPATPADPGLGPVLGPSPPPAADAEEDAVDSAFAALSADEPDDLPDDGSDAT
jgi:hypothetical protein